MANRSEPVAAASSSHALAVLSSRLLWSMSVNEAARTAAALGYQGLEVWTEHLLREGSRRSLRRGLSQVPLRYFLHGPFMDLNLCSRNPRVVQLSMSEHRRALSLARYLGISLIVVHPGHLSSSKDSPDEYWLTLFDSFGALLRQAKKIGAMLAVENMEARPKEFMTRPEDFERLFHEFPKGRIGLCLDLAHAASVNSRTSIEFVDRLGTLIRHIHLSNVASGRLHLPLDQGRSPLTPEVITFIRENYSGAVTVEGATGLGMPTAQTGLDRLHQLLGEEGGDKRLRTRFVTQREKSFTKGGTS